MMLSCAGASWVIRDQAGYGRQITSFAYLSTVVRPVSCLPKDLTCLSTSSTRKDLNRKIDFAWYPIFPLFFIYSLEEFIEVTRKFGVSNSSWHTLRHTKKFKRWLCATSDARIFGTFITKRSCTTWAPAITHSVNVNRQIWNHFLYDLIPSSCKWKGYMIYK